MRHILAPVLMLLAGCASAPPKLAWPKGFDAEIARVAGAEVVDCGFLDLSRGHGAAAVRQAARQCMTRARLAERPFKYGTVRVPVDSTVWEVFVQTDQGAYLFVQDQMPLEDVTQRWLQRCKSIKVDRGTGLIKGTGCFALAGANR